MAKPNRRGLGRGIDSLMGGPVETPQQATKKPERVLYNDEEVDYSDRDANLSGKTGSFNKITTTQTAPQKVEYEVVQTSDNKEEPVKDKAPLEEKIIERIVSRETSEEAADSKTGTSQDSLLIEVDIKTITPNPNQPRTNFKEEELEELSNSIKRDGLIQPILVREQEDGTYQIIAGERRWQASKKAGLSKVPVQIRNVDDEKALEIALIENIQRSDLNPIEEAYGYKRLIERRNMTQADVAQTVSKGRSTIANALRLLDLPEEAQQLLYEDKITAGHARAILSIPTKEERESLTKKIVANKLSVREAESIARLLSNKNTNTNVSRETLPENYKKVAKTLKELFETNVRIKSSKGKNTIIFEFKDDKELERLFKEMTAGFES